MSIDTEHRPILQTLRNAGCRILCMLLSLWRKCLHDFHADCSSSPVCSQIRYSGKRGQGKTAGISAMNPYFRQYGINVNKTDVFIIPVNIYGDSF